MLLVIPARMGSTRLPGKMLLKLRGNKSILQCTYERVLESKHAKEAELVIATDSREIADEVERFGGRYLMTKASHMSGSERAGEVLAQLSSEKPIDMVVNVQGDEPFLDPRHLDLTIQGLRENLWAHASTVAVKVGSPVSVSPPSQVKVVVDSRDAALYFSRSGIPHNASQWLRHIGIYAFRPFALREFVQHPPMMLERAENLEQLRLLEMGFKIHVSQVSECEFWGIDTAEDYSEARRRIK